MELILLGTRGGIERRSRLHRRHSSLLVEHRGARIMVDCGADWLGRVDAVAPTAIVLTHAHPDHAAGLAEGAPCPVYATRETATLLACYPIRQRRDMLPRKPVVIDGVTFEAFPVRHSIRAPAVGYRVSAEDACFFYLPDVAEFPLASEALRGCCLYIGDGATIRRTMVRKKSRTPIGHAPVVEQLRWCEAAGVCRAVFTHCGSEIVRGDGRRLNAVVRRLGEEQGVIARIARDGDRISLSSSGVAPRAQSPSTPDEII